MLHNPSAPLLHNLGSFAPQPRLLCSLADDAPQSQLLCLFDSTDHVFASFTIKLSTMQPTSCIRESPALPTKESRDFLHGQLKWPSFSILSHWCPKNTRDPTLDAWYKQTLAVSLLIGWSGGILLNWVSVFLSSCCAALPAETEEFGPVTFEPTFVSLSLGL
jgi:hypothetical protein